MREYFNGYYDFRPGSAIHAADAHAKALAEIEGAKKRLSAPPDSLAGRGRRNAPTAR